MSTTFQDFAQSHGITMVATFVGVKADKLSTHKPDTRELPEAWHHFAWSCTLTFEGRTYTTVYRLGLGHCEKSTTTMGKPRSKPYVRATAEIVKAKHYSKRVTLSDLEDFYAPTAPTLAAVLASLASDASGVLNAQGFEDWASEYGYDTDSREAERIYNACKEVHMSLHRLLGSATAAQLFDCEEV